MMLNDNRNVRCIVCVVWFTVVAFHKCVQKMLRYLKFKKKTLVKLTQKKKKKMDLGQKPFVVERQVFCSAFRVERYED